MLIEMTQTEDIRIIRLANGGANILSISNGMAAALFDAFNDALTYPSCKAIIIAGAGRMFCGGADLKDLPIAGELRDIFDAIEQSAKPVVVAMHGMALGGAVELAMAGHGRIAHSDTRFSLPEVNLGLLPGLGGTQRLPRLVGAEAALEMMLAGKTINAEEALAAGLIDHVTNDDVVAEAMALIRNKILTYRRTDQITPPADLKSALQRHRNETHDPYNQAQKLILDSVSAISEDFETGCAVERSNFDLAMKSENAQELLRDFFARRDKKAGREDAGPGNAGRSASQAQLHC